MLKLHYHNDDLSLLNSRRTDLNDVDLLARKYHPLHDEEVASTVTKQLRKISHLWSSHK